MTRIRLNKRGAELYSWLADLSLPLYGFIPHDYSFVIWDHVKGEWLHINQNFCEGANVICF